MKVSTDQLYSLRRKQGQVWKQIEDGGLSVEAAIAGTQGILEGIYPTLPAFQPPSWYVQPAQQIERVKEFLSQYGGGIDFTSTDIPSAPTNFLPRTPTEVLMLAVYLPDNGMKKGPQHTFDIWWDFVVPPTGYSKVRWNQLKSDSRNLRTLDCIRYRLGIRWVAFDPNANGSKSPKSCWDNPDVAPTLAGPEVLMALALFPEWATSWDGEKSMYPNMAGYQFKWEGAWRSCPFVTRDGGDRQLILNAYSDDYSYNYWACPSVREY